MPIYEFFCPSCNTIYSFFSRRVNTEKIPGCPRSDDHSLQRRVSLCAALSKKGSEEGDDSLDNLPIDESKMESAMTALAGEAENLNEDDPRQAARLMHKFSDMTGLRFNEKIQDALGRMEAGEDPEALEAEMGDALGEDENPFDMSGGKGAGLRHRLPRRDDTLYEM